jgi:flavin-binding protein dodecin
MMAHTYKVIEVVGSSETSIEDAISGAVAKAEESLRNVEWFEVVDTRGHVADGKVAHYQVTVKLGFRLE